MWRPVFCLLLALALPCSSAFAALICEDVQIALTDDSPVWIPVIAKPMSESVEARQARTVSVNFGLTDDTATIRIILHNSIDRPIKRDIVFNHARVERVEAIVHGPDGARHRVTKGSLVPGSREGLLPGFVFPVTVPPQASIDVTLAVQSLNGALTLPLAVAAPDEFDRQARAKQLIQVCMLAVILTIGVFLLLSNIISLDTIVGRAGLLLCALISYQLSILGWFDFFLVGSVVLIRGLIVVTGAAAVIAATAFLQVYFSTGPTYRLFHAVLTVMQIATAMVIVIAPFNVVVAQQLLIVLGGLSAVAYFVAPILYWRRSPRLAILHLTAWALPSLGFGLLILRNIGLVADSLLTNHGHLFGTAIGALLFAAIVKDRQVEAMRRSARMVIESEANLADLVQQRTAELEDRNQQLTKAVEALFASKVMLEQANQTKNTFLANMSHELRTPLNAINGYSEMIAEEYYGPVQPPRYREYAQHILTSGRHLLSVIDDLLDLARIEAGRLDIERVPINLGKLVEGCVAIMQPRAEEKRQRIEVQGSDDVPPLVADQRSIRQVILNLLGNASKYSPDGTVITVHMFIGINDNLHIEVIDRGMGIPEEAMPFIFEPFRRGDADIVRPIEGVGLGLPICKRLVELHGGRIRVFSRPGVGTRVLVTLPTGLDASLLDGGRKSEMEPRLKEKPAVGR